MTSLLAELALKYSGRPIVAMGGGVNLPSGLEQCPETAIYLSANEHGALLQPVDFIVCLDQIEEKLRQFSVPIIGRPHWCDYRIQDWEDIGNSGVTAAWVAWVLGGHPIILAGMNCYQGGTYHHDPDARSTGNLRTLEDHEERWKALSGHLPGAVVRSCSGPTVDIFGQWDPDESLPEFAAPPALLEMRAMVSRRVRTNELARLNHRRVPANLNICVSPNECEALLRKRTAVVCSGPDDQLN